MEDKLQKLKLKQKDEINKLQDVFNEYKSNKKEKNRNLKSKV